MGGDFRQLLPVIEGANRAKIVNHTLKSSATLWDDNVVVLNLQENMRVKNEMNKHPDDNELQEKLIDYEK